MKQTEKPGGAGQRFWDFFASVKLSFVLLLSLALASVLGTLLPQKEHVSVYVQQFGESGARLILGLRLDDMYHAPWFLLLLALLAFNLVVCSLNRLPQTLKLMAKEPAAELKRSRSAQESLTLAGSPTDHLARAEAERHPARHGRHGAVGRHGQRQHQDRLEQRIPDQFLHR